MKRGPIAAAFAILLVSAGGLYYGAFERPKSKAMEDVRSMLKDPDSAKFREVHYNSKNGVSCGLVNAKNGLGGYVGERKFIVQPGGLVAMEPDSGSPFDSDEQRIEKLLGLRRFLNEMKTACFGEELSPLEVDGCPESVPNCSWGRK